MLTVTAEVALARTQIFLLYWRAEHAVEEYSAMPNCHQQSSISRGTLRVNILSLNGHTAIPSSRQHQAT
eukprot:9868-Heterococcus_DN1.PRE.1